MVYETTRKCTLKQALNMNQASKKELISWLRVASERLSAASRLVYIALNVWHERGDKMPDLSHQQAFANMLEFLVNSQFDVAHHHPETVTHIGKLAESVGAAAMARLKHPSLEGPNANLYEYQSRHMIAAVKWHLTQTLFDYQKRVLKEWLEPFGITGGKLVVFLILLNTVMTEGKSLAKEHLDASFLDIDPDTPVQLSADEDLSSEGEEVNSTQQLKQDVLDIISNNEPLQALIQVHREFLLDILFTSYQKREPRQRRHVRNPNPRSLTALRVERKSRAVKSRQPVAPNKKVATNMAGRAGSAFANLHGQNVLLKYMEYLQLTANNLEIKGFDILPMGTDQPRYIKVDKLVILTAVEKLRLLDNDRQSLRNKVNLKDFINLKSVRLHNKAKNLQEISLSTDGFGCSITVEFDKESPPYANSKADLQVKKSKSVDVSKMRVGAVALTNCKQLGSRVQGANVIGVDPGKINVMVWTAGPVLAAESEAAAHRQLRQTGRLTAKHWRKLTLESQFDSAERQFKSYHPVVLQFEARLSQVKSKTEYLQIYLEMHEHVWHYYCAPFHRQWRLRKFCARQSAFDNVANSMVHNREMPSAPLKDDYYRRYAAHRRKKRLRQSFGRMLDPTVPAGDRPKPPVIAYGNAAVQHVKKTSPVPVRGFAYKLSRCALVVMVPEPNTSKLHAPCHQEMHMQNVGVMRCHHRHKKRRIDGHRRPVFCCVAEGEDGQLNVLHAVGQCPDRERKMVQSRLGVCQNCRVEGVTVFVDRDVNAGVNMREVVVYYAEHWEDKGRRNFRPEWNYRAVGRIRNIQ
ncbi:hypothetical protein MIR68_002713 [Amoeboaphelidium protococcarum]|nr:hypothetical protein MIR68_002713 [Amoeboaphelidium protococcarum]